MLNSLPIHNRIEFIDSIIALGKMERNSLGRGCVIVLYTQLIWDTNRYLNQNCCGDLCLIAWVIPTHDKYRIYNIQFNYTKNIDDYFGDLASTGNLVCNKVYIQQSESYLRMLGGYCFGNYCYNWLQLTSLLGRAVYGSGAVVWLCFIVLGRAEWKEFAP